MKQSNKFTMHALEAQFHHHSKYHQNRQTLLTSVSDFNIIFKCFSFVGIPFNTFKGTSFPAKVFLVILEAFFMTCAIYFTVVAITRNAPNRYYTYTLTSVSVHFIQIALRVIVCYKRNRIMQLVEELSYFAIYICKAKKPSLKKCIVLFCATCFLYGLYMHISGLIAMSLQRDDGRQLCSAYLFLFDVELEKYLFITACSLLHTIFVLTFPCMSFMMFILVGFLLKYLCIAFESCLVTISKVLNDQKMTHDDIVRCFKLLQQFNRIFGKTIQTVSFIIFLLFAFAFVSQLNLITLVLSIKNVINAKITRSYVVISILATFLGVSCITFTATSVQQCKFKLKMMIEKSYKNFLSRFQHPLYLLLLKYNEISESSITAWCMFKLHKGILVAIYGIIITYGYLLLQLSIPS